MSIYILIGKILILNVKQYYSNYYYIRNVFKSLLCDMLFSHFNYYRCGLDAFLRGTEKKKKLTAKKKQNIAKF